MTKDNTDIIFLTGFMGVGKSASGRALAAMLNRPFFDTDAAVERETGKTVANIFSEKGEEYFRILESRAVFSLAVKPCVIATGGGLITYGDNMERMKSVGTTAVLLASPEEILRRISSSSSARPLLQCADPAAEIYRLMQRRAYYYVRAGILINTDGLGVSDAAVKIKERLCL